MYEYHPEGYFLAGREALRHIRLAMLAARRESVDRVLDFGSGSGRVLRTLKAAFPHAALTACNLHQSELDFCAETFGAHAVKSCPNPDEIELTEPFDLIWSGSVLTHIDRPYWTGFLRLFESLLTPGGVVVFTVYGRFIADLMRTGANTLQLTPEQAEQVVREFDATGFGYHASPYDGDTLVSRTWVCTQLEEVPALELLAYNERAWLGQDVVACTKRTPATE
jgi:SAM-dependent methyltransferase